ncbi:MAG: hypothetical protein OEL83_11065 [Desulforhopalus sp.]|nr:hypothetical protein [Desulforhopalus sp.]
MHTFKTVCKTLLVAGTIMMFAAPAMAAGKQSKSSTGDQIRTRIPGSCKTIEKIDDSAMLQAIAARYGNGGGSGQGTRDRIRTPGSCKVTG